jgi:RNase P subunit RPR2
MRLRNVLIGNYPERRNEIGLSGIRCADCGTMLLLFATQRGRIKEYPDTTVLCARCARERMIRLNTTEKTDERGEKD